MNFFSTFISSLGGGRRVDRGAKVLDRVMPTWYYKVDTERLDVSDPANCILAQVYGSYFEGLRCLGLPIRSLQLLELGFVHPKDTRHWKRAISQRLQRDKKLYPEPTMEQLEQSLRFQVRERTSHDS